MLTKWQGRLSGLQSKGKPQPIVADQAVAEHLAREAALRDIAKEAGESGDKVVPLKAKAAKAKKFQKALIADTNASPLALGGRVFPSTAHVRLWGVKRT
jgi:hypothetical protein